MRQLVGLVGALLLAVGVSATYDPATALNAIHYAKAVKCPPANVSGWNCGFACDYFPVGVMVNVTAWQNKDDTQVFVGYNTVQNHVAVSYRGSTTLLNFLQDAEVWKVPYPACNTSGCEVHYGFYSSYQSAAPRVAQLVAGLLAANPTASVLLTGHSLGSAQAVLNALDVITAHPSVKVELITFGTPRVGNKAFVEYAEATGFPIRGTHYEVVHADDPVPHLPPMSWGYQHVPRQVWYDSRFPNPPGYIVCNGTAQAEDPSCADSVPWYKYNVSDHMHYLGVYTGCGRYVSAAEQEEAEVFLAKANEIVRRADGQK